jgi:hypothetical protein
MTSLSKGFRTNYCALSYSWGNPLKTRPLLIDGKIIYITESLDDALRQLLSLESTTIPFWIDAVCINQKDDVEKSWQVQQMMRIYERADFVLVWLGPASDGSDIAIDAIKGLGEEVSAALEANHWIQNAEISRVPETLRAVHHDSADRVAGDLGYPVEAIDKLFARPWWDRVWVVQEFIAGRDVLFLCGGRVFEQETLGAALLTLGMADALSVDQMMHGSTEIATRDYGRNTLEMFRARAKYQSSNGLMFEDLLSMVISCNKQASDPKDVLFALMGVAQNSEQFNIGIDYSKSVQEVYIQFMVKILNHGRLRALWLCHTASKTEGLPSWVPDWAAVGNEDRQPLAANPCTDCLGLEQPDRLFSASNRPILLSCTYTNGNASLKLYGAKLDSIRAVGPGVGNLEFITPSTFEEWMTTMLRMLRAGPYIYDNGLTDEEAVWRTSILDMEPVYDSEIYVESRQRARPEFYSGYLECAENNEVPNSLNKYIKGVKEFRAFIEGSIGRRPFVTENGYIGQGPPGVQVGDIAAIIHGAEVPFLFRRYLEKYQIIGEAYIHGIMDGEFMESDADFMEFDCC